MIDIILLGLLLISICFGFVVLFGAPYVPTLRPQINAALDLLDLIPGQTLIEVGSGDGRVLRAAAERKLYIIGYELNPVLVVFSLWYTRKHRKYVSIVWGNAFVKKWPATDGIFIFGLAKIMPKLHTKIMQNGKKSTKLVSIAFELPDVKPKDYKEGVFLYEFEPKE